MAAAETPRRCVPTPPPQMAPQGVRQVGRVRYLGSAPYLGDGAVVARQFGLPSRRSAQRKYALLLADPRIRQHRDAHNKLRAAGLMKPARRSYPHAWKLAVNAFALEHLRGREQQRRGPRAREGPLRRHAQR